MSKGKTATLPGMADERSEEVDNAALKLFNVRSQRQALTPKEVEAEAELREVIHKYGLERYYHEERALFAFIEKPKATVKARVRMGEAAKKEAGVEEEDDEVDEDEPESPVTSPGPDAPISEQTLKPFPKAAAEDE